MDELFFFSEWEIFNQTDELGQMLFVDEGEVIECSLEEGGEERGGFGDDFFLEVLNEAN